MFKDKQLLPSSIIEISSKNVTKEIVMLIHKIDISNGNGLDFKKEYVEKFKDTLINKPVVTKYIPIVDDLGHHEQVLDSDGNIVGLETIAIGTIKEVWIDNLPTDSTVKALYAKADLWNYKYPEIIACVEKLFNNDNADSSVEVEIYSYGENPTKEYRYATDYTYIGNCLLGSTIIPADSNAGIISIVQKEIAAAVKTDLENLEGKQKGENKLAEKEVFNKGFNIKFHIETNELSHEDIRQQIYNLINPVNPKTDERSYKYWIREVFQTYFIVESWDNGDKLYKIEYTLTNDSVVISSDWQQVEITYQPVGINLEYEINNLQQELAKVKEELTTMKENETKEVSELLTKISDLESKVKELNTKIVEQTEDKVKLESTITELNSTIEDLNKYKEQVETAEKEVKQTELSNKYSKLLSEETFKSEEVQNAIQELNSEKLNEIVVNEVTKEKNEVEVASKQNDDVIVVASKQDDLIVKNKQEYWASPRS